MANHKSAKKRTRQTLDRTERNKARRTEVRTVVKKVVSAISQKDKEAALSLMNKVQKLFDKLAHKGVYKKNTAARKTSRLAGQVAKL
ncbi:MAG: 30S ribosomal protein S20 [Bacteriovoracaceae bacterium]|nr:30S ribosomal protein S20 [Bacteriovoracaceae bacterium]